MELDVENTGAMTELPVLIGHIALCDKTYKFGAGMSIPGDMGHGTWQNQLSITPRFAAFHA